MSIIPLSFLKSTPVLGVLFLCLPSGALAVCAGNQIEIFACDFGQKSAELCLTAEDHSVTYRFGPPEAPEIELTRDYNEIDMRPWNGMGRTLWDEVTLHNSGFSYVLGGWYDKFDQTSGGSLTVVRGETTLANLECGARHFTDFEPLMVKMQDAGYCRHETWDVLREGPCT